MQPVGIGEKLVFTGLAGMLLLALIVAGLSFEQSRRRQDRLRYPQVGQSVDIGGRTLNLYCSGEGRPTIVFDTFSHQAGLSWIAVQAQAAKFVRACWYDRAGYGWSDPAPLPRTFKAVATDLHALLKAAHVPPPYVLVGSHDAASNIRVYNGLYSSEVAGIVLIDGNDIDVYAHRIDAPDFIKGPVEKHFGSLAPYMRESGCVVLPAVRRVGGLLPKIGRYRPTLAYGFPPEQQAELDFLSDRAYGEACDVKQNEADLRAAGNFGDRPLIVLASRQQQTAWLQNAKAVEEWNQWWLQKAQPPLARLSTRGRLVIVDNRVGLESIVEAIRDVVTEIPTEH